MTIVVAAPYLNHSLTHISVRYKKDAKKEEIKARRKK